MRSSWPFISAYISYLWLLIYNLGLQKVADKNLCPFFRNCKCCKTESSTNTDASKQVLLLSYLLIFSIRLIVLNPFMPSAYPCASYLKTRSRLYSLCDLQAQRTKRHKGSKNWRTSQTNWRRNGKRANGIVSFNHEQIEPGGTISPPGPGYSNVG